MQLKTGKMTTQELANWFGVSKKTFTNSAQKYLEKLSDYAEFNRVYGGVNITLVHFDTYVKGYNQMDDTYFNQEISRCVKEQNGLASISGIANKAKRDVPEYKDYAEVSIRYKMSKAATRNYGPCGDLMGGINGTREREWAIKLDDYNNYRALTEEEYALFVEITKDFQSKYPEKSIEKEKLEIRLKEKEIDVDEYFKLVDVCELDIFPQIMWEFTAQTGYKIVLATEYQLKAF